ncbi:hypothetical protein AJ80_07706 [Polytolypa hystricis UAMH7299]|uniref:Methyltransferase type 11 domain-containing protein n=1 Tax=Polytolypa hystricis (strain UAMH7299) TaxID=1447883 RepID=A0A2B7XJW8_POLH7|nr:hypothetical protein AJ80_07706 [Polytolypa hystricis UAMH7299]
MAHKPLYDSPAGWSKVANAYQNVRGRAPGTQTAGYIIDAANTYLPLSQATGVIDIGCGGGAITTQILDTHAATLPKDARIIASDIADGMLNLVRQRRAKGISDGATAWERLEIAKLDATDLSSIESGTFSHILSSFVYLHVPDVAKALAEAHRILGAEGVISLTSWKRNDWVDVLQVVKDISSDLGDIPTPASLSPTWCTADGARKHLVDAGFRDVVVKPVAVHWAFEGHEQVVGDILGAMPFMEKVMMPMTEDEKVRARELMVEWVRERHPEAPGELEGTAFVAVGRK